MNVNIMFCELFKYLDKIIEAVKSQYIYNLYYSYQFLSSIVHRYSFHRNHYMVIFCENSRGKESFLYDVLLV